MLIKDCEINMQVRTLSYGEVGTIVGINYNKGTILVDLFLNNVYEFFPASFEAYIWQK